MSGAALPPEAGWPDVLGAIHRVRNRRRTRDFALRALSDEQQHALWRLLGKERLSDLDGATAVGLLRAVFDDTADAAFVQQMAARLTPLKPAGDQ